jgi:Zn-dependent protease with chaperone function
MGKYTVAAILGCFYVVLSSWIVSEQGRAHRDALLRARPTSAEPPRASRTGDSPEAKPETPATAAPEPVAAEHRPEPVKPAPPPLVAAGNRTEPLAAIPVEPGANTPARASTPEPRKTSPGNRLSEEFAKATGRDLANVKLAPIDGFWEQPAAKKKWDVSRLSTDEEKQLGADLHEMVLHFNRRYGKAEAQERVEKAALPLTRFATRNDINYNFYVLDSSAVNAFSLPGGYIYVSRGLLDWISDDEDYALQFVLAHEIFHVDHKHALKCLEDPGLKQLSLGTLQLFYLFIIPRGYLPEQLDFDADSWALRQLRKLQCTTRECMTFLRKLKGYAEKDGWELERSKALPRSGNREALFDNHFRAHPATYQRLAKLEALAGEAAVKSP